MALYSFISYLTVNCIRHCSPDNFDHFGIAITQHGQQRLHCPSCFHNVLCATQRNRWWETEVSRNQKTNKNHNEFQRMTEDSLTSTIKTFCRWRYGGKNRLWNTQIYKLAGIMWVTAPASLTLPERLDSSSPPMIWTLLLLSFYKTETPSRPHLE